MKTIKILSILLFSIFTLSSCIDDTVDTDEFVNSPNLIAFSKSSLNATIIADGGTIDNTLNLLIKGPTSMNISEDITASLEIDPSSTAVEGTHFTLASNTVTFSPSNDLKTSVDFTVLSDGIASPSEVTLVLNIVNPSSSSVVPSGRSGQIVIKIGYLCPSDLAGEYSNPDVPSNANDQATFTEIGPGTYRISAMPYLGWGGTDPIYIDIIENCGNITVVGGEVVDALGATVDGSGTVSETTGAVTFTYTVYKADGSIWFDFSTQPSTYTPLP